MRRVSIVSILSALFIGLVATLNPAMQTDSPAVLGHHPVVGAWLIDLGDEGGRLLTLSDDGTALFSDVDGTTGHGTWEATADSTAAFTIWQLAAERLEEGAAFVGYFLIMGDITVDGDGSWTGDIAVAQADRDGVLQEVDGPFTLTASSIPVAQIDQLTPGISMLDSTSSATPAS
jgi:hypothetical protein